MRAKGGQTGQLKRGRSELLTQIGDGDVVLGADGPLLRGVVGGDGSGQSEVLLVKTHLEVSAGHVEILLHAHIEQVLLVPATG